MTTTATPSSQKDRESLIDKVQALLNKAEATDFPQEAEAFRNKAADLMAKFAITNNEFRGEVRYLIHDLDLGGEDPTQAEMTTANAVAKFNGCLCVIHTSRRLEGNSATLKITGTEGDIAGFLYLFDSVNRQAGSAFLDRMNKLLTTKEKKVTAKYRSEFLYGFSLGLSNKVNTLMLSRDRKINEYGLVPINEVQKARNFYESTLGKLSTGKQPSAKWDQEGLKAGGNASLSKGLSTRTSNGLQISL